MKKIPIKISKMELLYTGKLALLAMLLNLVIELLNKDSFLDTFKDLLIHPHIFVYNSFIILVTLSFALLLKRRIVFVSAMSVVWIALGITNNILLNFRTTPFTAVDLRLISEAIPIIDKYMSMAAMILIVVAAVAVLIGLVIAFIKVPKIKHKINYLANSIAVAVLFVFILSCTKLGMNTNVLAKNFGNIHDAYLDYGFAYCFMNSLLNTGMDKPKNYSSEKIDSIVEVTNDEGNAVIDTTDAKKKTPNIIFLQLESFFDPTHVKDFTFSSDPLPTFRWLKQNFTTGYLSVPCVGAGTANTEFEINTGMNLDFFGPGEYPYKTILLGTTCESMAYNMKALGYATHAIHNNTATFYGRNVVFPNLGFDSFTSIEYMPDIQYNPLGWAKDDMLTDEILKAMGSTPDEPDYIYTISVQGHGKYPDNAEDLLTGTANSSNDSELKDFNQAGQITDKIANTNTEVSSKDKKSTKKEKKKSSKDSNQSIEAFANAASKLYDSSNKITIDGIDKSRKYAFEYYVNQIHEMDQFLANLILTLENYDEDVVLVMYGDHLPSLGIKEEDLTNGDLYQTEYVIWSNHDVINGKHDRDLQAYELSSYVQELCGQNSGLLTKCHQRALALTDENADPSVLSSMQEASEKESQKDSSDSINELPSNPAQLNTTLLNEFELLQYDMLYGKQDCYGGTNPYLPTDMKLGCEDISITRVSQTLGSVIITGKNFTDFSHIEVDGKLVSSTRIGPNTIQLDKETSLDSGSSVCVVQIEKNGTQLSQSEPYIIP